MSFSSVPVINHSRELWSLLYSPALRLASSSLPPAVWNPCAGRQYTLLADVGQVVTYISLLCTRETSTDIG